MWVAAYVEPDGRTEIYHLDGIPWHEAPRPRRWHRCKAQTRGWTRYFNYTERCRCGAVSFDGRRWINRNERN